MRPDPIRLTVMRYARSLLQQITDDIYFFNVGKKRVFLYDFVRANAPAPASIFVVQRTEAVTMGDFGRVERSLSVNIGFIAEYGGDQPDEEAAKFIADIQFALGYQHNLSGLPRVQQDGSYLMIGSGTVTFDEIGNAINVTEPITGFIHGQVDYTFGYETLKRDPCSV